MQLISTPVSLPGSCFFCGSASRESYIDTTLSIEFHGAFYICNICAKNIGTLVGMMDEDKAILLRQENESLQGKIEELTLALKAAEESIRGLTVFRRYAPNLSSSDSSEQPVTVSSDEDVEEPSGREETVESKGKRSSKSANEQGMDDIRSTTRDTEFKLDL